MLQPGIHGSLFSEISGKGNQMYSFILPAKLFHLFHGLVLRAVIHIQQLEFQIMVTKEGFILHEFLIKIVNILLFVVAGNNC